MKKQASIILLCIPFCLLISLTSNAQITQIIYVKKGATGSGTSWSNAYGELHQALTAAASGSGKKEIWVSQGEYHPTYDLDRTKSFVIPAQTTLFGGFVGDEPSKGSGNWRNIRSILSGDLGAQFYITDNSYHVLTAKDIDNSSGLDGFIITDGNANGVASPSFYNSGGGMLIAGTTGTVSITINNCEFINNAATNYGGGLAIISEGGTITSIITNSYFNGNTAVSGGGASNYKTSGTHLPVFVNCSFSVNLATQGGGALANIGSKPFGLSPGANK